MGNFVLYAQASNSGFRLPTQPQKLNSTRALYQSVDALWGYRFYLTDKLFITPLIGARVENISYTARLAGSISPELETYAQGNDYERSLSNSLWRLSGGVQLETIIYQSAGFTSEGKGLQVLFSLRLLTSQLLIDEQWISPSGIRLDGTVEPVGNFTFLGGIRLRYQLGQLSPQTE